MAVHYIRMLDFLAQQINPKNVLIFCRGGWRQENFGAFASEAKARGFRLSVYEGFQFVAPDHPRYAEWEPYFYRSKTEEILGYEGRDGIITAYINPAASAYRKFHVQTLKNLQETYNIDVLTLDVNYFIVNQAPIDGLTPIQGNMLLHEELIAAMPDTVFAGEFIHAVTALNVAFYARTTDGNHPISDFLFSQWSVATGHNLAYLGDRHKAHELELLNVYIKRYKQLDVLPTIRYYFEHHLEVQHAISILDRTHSNAEFWEELGRMVNSPYREDLNFDGVVNILDLLMVANAFGDPRGPDLNGDGVVNILDLVIVANAFN